jgi:glucose/arabinose dehydrogenase
MPKDCPRVFSRRGGLVALLVVTIALAACGGGATPTETAPPPTTGTLNGATPTVLAATPTSTIAAAPAAPATPATTAARATAASATASRAATASVATPVAVATPTTAPPSAAGPPRPVTIMVPRGQGQTAATERRTLTLPEGFEIGLYGAGLNRARFLAWSPEGDLTVTELGSTTGRVSVLRDRDRDGTAEERVTFAEGLRNPHGLAFRDGHLYVAEEHRVARFRWQGGAAAASAPEVIIPDLPTGGHFTRTIGFGPDGKLYLSVGSSCNVCAERDARRAAIWQYNADGSGGRLYARGLRNAVGFVWRPGSAELWATNNGRDNLGDDLPPETINLVRDGDDFGWPYCHNGRIRDPQFGQGGSCDRTVPPAIEMQAHSAPLGLAFGTGASLPADYADDLFIASHGSWNRSTPTGYKIVRAPFAGGQATGQVEDFITGWLPDGSNTAWGRPVDVLAGPDGSLYISDDGLGVIYRVSFTK